MLCSKYKNFLNMVLYQVYPRSFMDSNGDGIGDINGIISKLDYLKDLGVNAIWLSPCYKSPNDDNGYDISDYRDIMDEFGTLDDAKRLIKEMHDRDMKLIMDLVPNHTSTAHKWFQESRKSKDNPYSDYYYWFDSPPNDWKSAFGGTAWEYDETRRQYYLHSYVISQADLNWNNPKVVKEMQDVVDFWVDLGVDGFRCDVIDQISKDFENGQNSFGPRLHEFIHALFGREKTKDIFTVGECWCDTLEEMCNHVKAERGELSTVFQFDHIDEGRKWKFDREKPCLKNVSRILTKWQNLTIENDLLYTLFTDNHDQPQYISRMSDYSPKRYEAATLIAGMFYTLKGVALIYQGQEFGTPAAHYDSIDEFDDIESINGYAEMCETISPEEAIEKINFGSRDNTRRPMCWDDSEFGGFSTVKPWIPLHSELKDVNLKTDLASDKSVFKFYKELLKLRASTKALIYGDFEEISKDEDNYFAFVREYEQEKILVVCNFEDEKDITLPYSDGELLLGNYGDNNAISGEYRQFEVRIFKIS